MALYDNIISFISSGGWTYKDVYELPISKRNWIFQRFYHIMKTAEEESEVQE